MTLNHFSFLLMHCLTEFASIMLGNFFGFWFFLYIPTGFVLPGPFHYLFACLFMFHVCDTRAVLRACSYLFTQSLPLTDLRGPYKMLGHKPRLAMGKESALHAVYLSRKSHLLYFTKTKYYKFTLYLVPAYLTLYLHFTSSLAFGFMYSIKQEKGWMKNVSNG